MEFIKTEIDSVVLIKPIIHQDNRGCFVETYNHSLFTANGIPDVFVQDNVSLSKYGVLRGLHYQVGSMPQAKLVRCSKGKILDVAVDIRVKSLTYMQYVSYELSEENMLMLYVPIGFAHGFVALENSVVQYKVSNEYSKLDARSIIYNDNALAVNWHIKPDDIILSEQDKKSPKFKDIDIWNV